MLRRDVVVLEPAALVVGPVEHARERAGDVRLLEAALQRRQGRELRLRLGAQGAPVGEELLVEQREQEVVRRDLGVPPPPGELLRRRDGLLSLDGQLVEIHVRSVLVHSRQ